MATPQTAAQGADPRGRVTSRSLIIVGGGEHARVVADAVRSEPEVWSLVGYTAPDEPGVAALSSLEHLGDDATVARRLAAVPGSDRPAFVLAFGGPPAERRAATGTFGPDADWAVVIHRAAWVSDSAVLDPGVVVLAGAIVNAGAHVGSHAIVNSRAVVEHDVVVGAGSHVAPGAVIGGGTRIGEDTMIGLGAAVRDHISIGHRVIVGMGAVVVADVADGATVMGIPARG
jgi:sugar O-acyltransferase (sialic acid O-acetyltransferase NeuD family)